MTTMPALQTKDLSCGYGNSVVLRDVTFTLKRGDFVGIIGPNGSGKTTLLRAISGFLQVREGEILVEGESLDSLGHKRLAAKVAVVTQTPETMPPFTVGEFALLGRIPHWRRLQFLEGKRDHTVTQRALELTGISHLKDRPLRELSGGERQLASVARALAQEPQLLFLDEPTAHLDIGHQVQIMDLLKRLNREASLTAVVVLHDLNLAGFYCDRLILLHTGRLFREGHPKDVLTESILEEVYRTKVMVGEGPESTRPFVLPIPS